MRQEHTSVHVCSTCTVVPRETSTCTQSLLPKECLCNFAVYTSRLILDRSNFVLQDMLESMQEENPSEPIRLPFEWMHFIQELVVFILEMYQDRRYHWIIPLVIHTCTKNFSVLI